MSNLEDRGPHRRPDPSEMAAPRLVFDLGEELNRLRQEPEWARGQNAKTLVKHEDFRIVLTALKAGARIPGHSTQGRISIQTVQGVMRVRAGEESYELPAGSILALDRHLPHDVEAVEEGAFLLTIAWPA